MPKRTSSFSQRHPFLFGFMLIMAAMILLVGIMAAFRYLIVGNGQRAALDFSGDKLGVVRLTGFIADSGEITDWIRTLREDDSVKGVLLRVDSGGGAVAPSQEMYSAVRKLAEVKPVVASFGSTAASGGYYAAAPAHEIWASPATLTGSIGVILQITNFKDLADKLGVKEHSFISGKYKDAGSPLAPLSPEARAYLQSLVMDLHEQFVSDVAAGRNMDRGRVAALADGRAMTGRKAHELGLVDQLGDMEDAVKALKDRCGITGKIPTLDGPPKERDWFQEFLGSIDININTNQATPGFKLSY